jgi:hypothetical protein
MSQSALYSETEAKRANVTLQMLGIASWAPSDVIPLQKKIGAKADGWFGPASIVRWKAQRRVVPAPSPAAQAGGAIIDGAFHEAPVGLSYVNHLQKGGIPAQLDDTEPRKHPVTQLILHRGWAGNYAPGVNFAAKTEETLDARGLSGSHSMDIDGTIYQHFDPAVRRGRHASHHNVQSDSLDIGGPFDLKRKPAPGQTKVTFKAAIGKAGDGRPPLSRPMGVVKCWSLTPAQEEALVLFLPWWCDLRGIPLRACSDMRCFRLSSHLGLKDPVTNVTGILAHAQCGEPGTRVDGLLPLYALQQRDTPIDWYAGSLFFS